jgi:uncharacterized protein (DUF2147 family)
MKTFQAPAPKLRQRYSALGMAFALAVGPQMAQGTETSLTEGTTYWKTNIVDSVIALRPCPESGVCGKIVWINPEDRDAFDYFGDPAVARDRRIDAQDIQSLCGYSPKMAFEQVAPNQWKGTMDIRGKGVTANMAATQISENELRIRVSKFIFSETDTWTRVTKNDPRYPHCAR